MKLRASVLACMATLSASGGCAPKPAAVLADGCYYDGGTPIFKIAGHEGRTMVPGEIQRFRVEPGDDAHVIFVPGFLLDGVAPNIRNVTSGPARQHIPIKPGPVPTAVINWAAYGQSDVQRGKPC